MKLLSEYQEPQIMPRWLFIMYRFVTALAILMLIAAAISLIASVFLGIDSLWNWGALRAAELRNLLACM